MGVIARALAPRVANQAVAVPFSGGFGAGSGSNPFSFGTSFQSGLRMYRGNEILGAGLDLLAKSASEPRITGRRWRRARRSDNGSRRMVGRGNRPQEMFDEVRRLSALGYGNLPGQLDNLLLLNGFFESVDDHPLVRILNQPNPWQSGGQLWGLAILDYFMAGNAYILKARYADGPLKGAVGELYRLRPDRMRPVAGDMSRGEPPIKAWEYVAGQEQQTFPASDVIHFHTWALAGSLGEPPLMRLMDRISIDQYMRTFLRTFYERGGASVGASFNIKNATKMDQESKDDLRERFRRIFGGGQYDVLVTTAEEATYTPFGLNRGLRDALPKEIDAVTEARIGMVLGIPGSILGLLIGYESSSYANKRQDWQVFWDITMAPLLGRLDDELTLSLAPEFGGVDEVAFDLSDIRALQEDEDKLQERARKNLQVGGWTREEFRERTGVDPAIEEGTYLTPANVVPTPAGAVAAPPAPPETPGEMIAAGMRMLLPAPDVDGPSGLSLDPEARRIYDEAVRLRDANPGMTWSQISARVGVVERTLRRYRAEFDGLED